MKKLTTALAIAALTWSLVAVAGATTTPSASLHPPHVGATNPGFQEGSCPSEGYGWHFVLPGRSNTFVTLEATFETAGVITAFESHPTAKHAYVYTPGPDTLLGATATINGTTTTFVLSHVCPGDDTTTTTTTPDDDGTTTTTVDGGDDGTTTSLIPAVTVVNDPVATAQPTFTG